MRFRSEEEGEEEEEEWDEGVWRGTTAVRTAVRRTCRDAARHAGPQGVEEEEEEVTRCGVCNWEASGCQCDEEEGEEEEQEEMYCVDCGITRMEWDGVWNTCSRELWTNNKGFNWYAVSTGEDHVCGACMHERAGNEVVEEEVQAEVEEGSESGESGERDETRVATSDEEEKEEDAQRRKVSLHAS